MNIQKIKTYKSDISYFNVNKNGVVVIDKENRVYIYDNDFKLKNAFKIKLPDNRPEENSIAVDDNFNFLLLSVSKYPLTLWDIQNKKLMGKFQWHRGDVLCVKFDKNVNYFASGGIDGKVFLYSVELKKMVSRVVKYKDFISDIAFDGEYLCAGSYDKSIMFTALDSFKKQIRKPHLKKVKKVEKKENLISSSEITDIVCWNEERLDIEDKFNVYREFRDFDEYEGYLFIAVKNKIVLYNIQKQILINDNFLSIEASKIKIFDDKLYYCINNELYSTDLFDERELLDYILKNNYKKAYEMIAGNPFLTKTKAYEKLETLYKLTLKKAVKYFEQNLKSKAIEILKPFMNVLQKREEIAKFINSYENIIKFKAAFEKKNYPLFYQIASQYELLKNTKYYKIVEKEWEVKFETAKKLAIEGKINDAKEILKNFIAVSEKLPLINLVLKQAAIFRLLKEKIAKKDFKGFFALVKEHPELKNTKEYSVVMEYAQKLYEKALKALKDENFKEVLKISETLNDIEGYELKAKELIQKANIALEFLRLFNEDKNKAFEMAEKYPFLKNLSVYRLFEEKWNNKLKNAEKYAFEGKISKALETLKEYEHIHKKKMRIKNMLKSAYLNHIQQTHDKNAIKKYLKVFGNDDEINMILAKTNFNE
jgi:hypothetical protein